tara:strand:- start:186 stop:392 length:207 start_codon:yes stop_codon:yes gene_type:complete
MKEPADYLVQHSVRLPAHILEEIRQQARANRRSVNSEIIIGLETAIAAKTETAPGGEIAAKTPDAAQS